MMMVVMMVVVMMVMMVLNDSIGCDVSGGMTIVKVMMMVMVIMVLRLQQVFPYLRSGFTRFSWWSPWAWSRW